MTKKYDFKKNFISPSKLKNYFLNDTILDFINRYQKKFNFIKKEDEFNTYLKNKGKEFESHIYNLISNRLPTKKLSDFNKDKEYNKYIFNTYKKTINYMEKGIPIIFQGVLIDFEEKLYGIPDIIIRSDFIDKLMNNSISYDIKKGCKFSKEWYYIIIDIKYCNLYFRKDNVTLINKGLFSYYKGQVYLYSKILNKIQENNNYNSYILGRKWIKKTEKGNNSFDYLGLVDFLDKDSEIPQKILDSINWQNKLNKYGDTWDLFSNNIPELYPNMNNSNYDKEWRHIKEMINEKKNDITSIWNCGIKHRKNGFEKNIYSWIDEKCNSEIIGINGKRRKIINKILDLNRNENERDFLPNKIINNKENLKKNNLEFFVDFETVNIESYSSYIFMIGFLCISYNEITGSYESVFQNFIVNNFTLEEENRIIELWINYMKNLELKFDIKAKIYHWSNAEVSFYYKARIRNNKILDWPEINFMDLLKVFKSEPIIIRGALRYGLKEIATNLYNLGYINTIWDMDMDGRIAMIKAEEALKKSKINKIKFSDMRIIKTISKYNYIDCQVVYEILEFIRNNML